MKAMIMREFGGPEVLRWEEVPTPTPGLSEVLIRVHAVSVNRTLDLQVRQDGGGYGTVLPLVLGHDPSIDRVIPLSQAAEAHRLVAQNETLGKIIRPLAKVVWVSSNPNCRDSPSSSIVDRIASVCFYTSLPGF